VRPEPIGDAFVLAVVQDREDIAAKVVAGAWRADARGALRSSLRLGGSGDVLCRKLAAGPPADAAFDPVEIALAYAEAAMRIPRPHWDVGDFGTGRGLLEPACTRMRTLEPTEAKSALTGLLALAEVDNRQAVVLGGALLHLATAGLAAIATGGSMYADEDGINDLVSVIERLIAVISRWNVQPWTGRTVGLGEVLSNLWEQAVHTARREAAIAKATERLAVRADFSVAEASVRSAVFASLHRATAAGFALAGGDERTVAECRALMYATAAAAYSGEIETTMQRANELGDTARNGTDRNVFLAHAAAWRYVGYAHSRNVLPGHDAAWTYSPDAYRGGDPAVCREAVDKVEAIAAPFAGERDFEQMRAAAWADVAFAHFRDPAVRREMADKVEAIAAPFTGERDFELQRAKVWSNVSLVYPGDPAACREAAGKVDSIATPFDGQRDFEQMRAAAWANVALAHLRDPAVCREMADKVEAIAAPFAGERLFERSRLHAWACVSHAHQTDPAACREAADKVDAIAAPFAGDLDFERMRAVACVSVAYAHRREASDVCREAASKVEAIAALFNGERGFEYVRGMAWGHVVRALFKNPAACREAADKVDTIAAPFAGDLDFELQRAEAWRTVGYAHCKDPAACREAADKVEAIAAPFTGERDFGLRRAQAWVYVAHAHREDAEACREAVSNVEAIAAAFDGDIEFEVEREQARRCVAAVSMTSAPPKDWGDPPRH
jgi:hypothetical protein